VSHNLKDRWEKFRLGDIGKVITGKTPPTKNREYYGDRYPFITPSDIKTFDVRYLTSVERYLSQQGFQYQEKKLLPPKSICYVCIGSTVGKMCMTRVPSFTNQQLNSIICDETKVTPYFLFYKLQFETPRIQSIAEGKGSGKSIINRTEFENLEIRIPPLEEQHRIASILSAYDDLIENNLRRVRILEEMAQTLYREWFVKFRFPDHETVWMVDSPLGKIPEGWEAVALKEMVKSVKDNVKAGRHLHQIPYLPIGCLPRKSLAIVESKPGKEAKSSLIAFKKRDIIFGAMRPYFHKVVIAPFAGTTRSTCVVLRPIEEHSYSWAVLTLFEDNTVEYANKHSRGTTIPYAVWDGSLSEMPCVLPPDELMEKFNEIVSPTLESIRLSYFRQLNLRRTRDLLLSRLISGDLDVSDLDIGIREGTT